MQVRKQKPWLIYASICVVCIGLSVLLISKSAFNSQVAISGIVDAVLPADTRLAYTVPSRDAQYRLIQNPLTSTTKGLGISRIDILMAETDFLSRASNPPTTDPPVFSFLVFSRVLPVGEPETADQLVEWARNNSGLTLIYDALADPQVIQVGDHEAIFYQIESTYETDVYLMAHERTVYLLAGQFRLGDTKARTDFAKIMQSVSFK